MGEPRRDHYLAPVVGNDTELVLQGAIEHLADLRGLPIEDATARLHVLASLIAETERRLPHAVNDARHQQCSWAEIGDLLGVTRASAQQRYHHRTTPP